jgi:hypothetical protein
LLDYCAVAPAALPGTLAPELDPEPDCAPEPALDPDPEPEPMPGQCLPIGPPFGGVPVFDPGAGAVGLGVVDVVVVGVADCDVDGTVLVEPDDAAPALEMPASAPPLASAPATIVAPSSFDVFMRSILLG